ncbi:MAG: DUF4013 domain-containing protein [Anaerolineaceae bacterium]|nr:DUF4013 domain-containing protein [Anaerolineaceae bacterium]
MEFGLAFSYQFKDPDWIKKIALAGLFSLIPVVGVFFLMGWSVEVTRRVILKDPNPLPELNFGAYLGKGFQLWVIGLVYALPIFILTIPIMLVPPLGVAVELDENTLGIVMAAISICCGGLIFLYSLLLALMLPAAYGNFAAKGSIGAGLRFGEVFGLVKAAPVAYLLCLVGSLVAGFIAPLGSIACGLGVVVTGAYSLSMLFHLYGQAYNQALAKSYQG